MFGKLTTSMGADQVLDPSNHKDADLEVRKLRAEAEKAEAERDKLRAETQETQGLLARMSKLLTPLVAALAVVVSYEAGTYRSQVSEAKLQTAQAELDKQRVLTDKSAAEHDLAVAKDSLASTNKAIVAAGSARQEAEKALRTSQEQLRDVRTQYDALKKQQTEQMTLGNLRKLIDILYGEPSDRKIASSRYIEDIRREVTAEESYKDARVVYLTTAAQSDGLPAELRGLLYYALFRVTGQNAWLDQVRRLAAAHLVEAPTTFVSLMSLKYFDSKDRADTLCQSYPGEQQLLGKVLAVKGEPAFWQELFTFEKLSFVLCRRPYLDHLERLRRPTDYFVTRIQQLFNERDASRFLNGDYPATSLSNEKVVEVPAQAVLMWFLSEHPTFDPKTFESVSFDEIRDWQIPADLISALRSGSAETWIKQHPSMMAAWTTRGFGKIEISTDTTMLKILSGIWITEADLP